jgi:uncharacterized membrane protein YcjF (UPF0283 family)
MNVCEISELQALLEKVFDFSIEDVRANRNAKMSEAQKALISQKHYANSRFAWIAFSIIFGLGLIGGSIDIIRSEKDWVEFLQIYLGVTIFFAVVVLGFISYYRRQISMMMREGGVLEVKGKIEIVGVRGEKLMNWCL